MIHSPHDSIVAPEASNPQPFGYESYALTNYAITVRRYLVIIVSETSCGSLFRHEYLLLLLLLLLLVVVVVVVVVVVYL